MTLVGAFLEKVKLAPRDRTVGDKPVRPDLQFVEVKETIVGTVFVVNDRGRQREDRFEFIYNSTIKDKARDQRKEELVGFEVWKGNSWAEEVDRSAWSGVLKKGYTSPVYVARVDSPETTKQIHSVMVEKRSQKEIKNQLGV